MGIGGRCGHSLTVCEAFGSIQGEGPKAGSPTFFIRLSGCNLKCSYCDSKYSWADGEKKDVEAIARMVPNKSLVDITGGEPTMNPDALAALIDILRHENKCDVMVETNGTQFVELSDMVWVMCSPKLGHIKGDVIKRWNFRQRTAFKFVIRTKEDYMLVKDIVKQYGLKNVYLMPEGVDPAVQLSLGKQIGEWLMFDNLPMLVSPRLHILFYGNARGK